MEEIPVAWVILVVMGPLLWCMAIITVMLVWVWLAARYTRPYDRMPSARRRERQYQAFPGSSDGSLRSIATSQLPGDPTSSVATRRGSLVPEEPGGSNGFLPRFM